MTKSERQDIRDFDAMYQPIKDIVGSILADPAMLSRLSVQRLLEEVARQAWEAAREMYRDQADGVSP